MHVPHSVRCCTAAVIAFDFTSKIIITALGGRDGKHRDSKPEQLHWDGCFSMAEEHVRAFVCCHSIMYRSSSVLNIFHKFPIAGVISDLLSVYKS